MTVRQIVVGMDNSPGSCAAVRWVVDLAAALDATVTAVHAFEPLGHIDEIEPGTDFATVRDQITEQLKNEWCRPFTEKELSVELVVKEGRPADVIIDVARAIDADLIVVGARRMGWFKELTLGSTSHRVLHEAQRPVTVIHSPDE